MMGSLEYITIGFLSMLMAFSVKADFFNPYDEDSKYSEAEEVHRTFKEEEPFSFNFTDPDIVVPNSKRFLDVTNIQKVKEYQAKGGETLVWIAYKIYGDVSKWKEIYELNKNVINDDYSIKQNATLAYEDSEFQFSEPLGRPYYVKRGDTLRKISKKVFGTEEKWRNLWKYNPKQIQNPNLIFEGFTLYYSSEDPDNYIVLY